MEHGNPVFPSHLPLPEQERECFSETRMCDLLQIEMVDLSLQEIKRPIQRDPLLSKGILYCLGSWPVHVPLALQAYHLKMAALCVVGRTCRWS